MPTHENPSGVERDAHALVPYAARLGRAAQRCIGMWAILAAALVVTPRASGAQGYADTTLFAVDNTTALYTVNRLTGAATQVGTLLFTTSALARDPVSGRLYYTATNAATPNGRVAYWDPSTGTNTLLNSTGLNDVGVNDNVVRLGFNASGVLYGIGATPATLYTISTTTGAYTSLGVVRVGSTAGAELGGSGDIAFDYDGTLYAGALDASNQTSLYKVSLAPSGGVYVATATGVIVNTQQASLAFVADGRLYSAGANQNIYAVSKSGGASTTIVAGGPIAYYDFATVPRFANMSITGSTAGLPRNDTASFNLVVSNAGPQFANGPVTVLDTLPAGLTYQRVVGAGWSCASVGQVVTCTRAGTFSVGASSGLTLYTNVGAVATGTVLTSILHVTSSTIDQDQSGNRITIAGTVVGDVDFRLTKTHAGNFTVGQNGVYTIAFTNTGTNATTGTMTVTDTLPVGMTYVSGAGTSWACARTGTLPDIVTCTRSVAVASNAATSVTLTVAVAAAAAPARTNTVYVSGGGSLSTTPASDPTTVSFTGVSVTPDSGTVSQLPSNGTNYTGSFTVTNTGNLADSYTLTVSKAPGTTITIISVNGTAGSTATVAVAVGASLVVPVVYSVANAAAAGAVDTLKLLATSTSVATTKDPGAITVTVMRAGLSMTKQLFKADQITLLTAGSQVSPGDTLQFRVTVLATGSAGSTAVHVTDPLPPGVSFISSAPDLAGWTITQAGGVVTADLATTLPVGQSRYFWIRVKVR